MILTKYKMKFFPISKSEEIFLLGTKLNTKFINLLERRNILKSFSFLKKIIAPSFSKKKKNNILLIYNSHLFNPHGPHSIIE